MKTIKINKIQETFIQKAINNKESLFDFEDTTKKEFKEDYGFTIKNLLKEIGKLQGALK